MTYRFSPFANDMNPEILKHLDRIKVYSEKDDCYVVSVLCSKCPSHYEEELEEAKAKVASSILPVCLACDVEAEKPGLSKVGPNYTFGASW